MIECQTIYHIVITGRGRGATCICLLETTPLRGGRESVAVGIPIIVPGTYGRAAAGGGAGVESVGGLCASDTQAVRPKVTSACEHLCDVVAEDLHDESVGAVGLGEQRCSDLTAPGVQGGHVEDSVVPPELRGLEHCRAPAIRDAETNEVHRVETFGSWTKG